MYPGTFAISDPDKPAYVMAGSGRVVTYKELDERSNGIAHLLAGRGVTRGDVIAVYMENRHEYLMVTWAAQRSGLYFTPISSRLKADELAYIVNDSGAKALFSSAEKLDVAAEAASQCPVASLRFCVDEGSALSAGAGFESLEEATAGMPTTARPDECEGADLLYSSGTTGKPKGVKLPLTFAQMGSAISVQILLGGLYGATKDTVYLSPAPLYHAAPLRFTMAMQRLGGTAIVMERFDPVDYLQLIERHRVTHTQVVPTMFVRMLKLPAGERATVDVSSLTCAIHAAAPCPVPVKQEMIEWWGPVIFEYYAGTEANGFVACNSEEWLAHPGTVGRPLLGRVHILDEDCNELPTGEDGGVYFEGGAEFEYLNDPEKTKASRSPQGWSTLGDVGHVDADGYLYLTDRKAYMIISGGVNIYPQEAENLLVTHPKVMDVAVFGVPDPELGQQVKAVVQPIDMAMAGDGLAEELIAFCKEHLASYKCPRSVDFEAELPRHPTGKLYKRLLRDRYWAGHTTHLI